MAMAERHPKYIKVSLLAMEASVINCAENRSWFMPREAHGWPVGVVYRQVRRRLFTSDGNSIIWHAGLS